MYWHGYNKLVVVVLTVIIFAGCEKSSTSSVEEARQSFDREGLKFIQIPIGKYFIYKDSATGNEDSVIVTKSNLEQVDVAAYYCGPSCFGNHPAYHYERFSLTLTSGRDQTTWLNATTGDLIGNFITSDRSAISLRDYKNILLFSYPGTSTILPSMAIEGKTYNEVNVSTANFSGTASTTYWAKNIGLIKWQFKMGSTVTTFLLLRHG
ncbi:hypothetical protein [Segetibacter aerophilus]|uniref:Uncharacterized protein n=1 Tax=Segetibacter aerophilus TaxID=670293 RepID=A0A512BGT4_9BACT|nr:hypothetical protein [Segetibacter aerophilus]GEO11085.1 hypothetical protein SAE01_35810 [Segetibacter aerophilus]